MCGVLVIYSLPFLLSFAGGLQGSVLTPQISLPPCTETLCVKPCGLHHVKSLAFSVSCYSVDNQPCPFVNVSGSLTLDISVQDLIIRSKNITLTMGPGISVSLPSDYDSYCFSQERHERNACPIPANTPLYAHKLFYTDKLLPFVGKKISAIATIEDESGQQLVCLSAEGHLDSSFLN